MDCAEAFDEPCCTATQVCGLPLVAQSRWADTRLKEGCAPKIGGIYSNAKETLINSNKSLKCDAALHVTLNLNGLHARVKSL